MLSERPKVGLCVMVVAVLMSMDFLQVMLMGVLAGRPMTQERLGLLACREKILVVGFSQRAFFQRGQGLQHIACSQACKLGRQQWRRQVVVGEEFLQVHPGQFTARFVHQIGFGENANIGLGQLILRFPEFTHDRLVSIGAHASQGACPFIALHEKWILCKGF